MKKMFLMLALLCIIGTCLVSCNGNELFASETKIGISKEGYWLINGAKTQLKASDGSNSTENPLSDYELAVQNGFVGTEEEWREYIANLNGGGTNDGGNDDDGGDIGGDISGTDTPIPELTVIDGYWCVDGVNTGVKYGGENGADTDCTHDGTVTWYELAAHKYLGKDKNSQPIFENGRYLEFCGVCLTYAKIIDGEVRHTPDEPKYVPGLGSLPGNYKTYCKVCNYCIESVPENRWEENDWS